MTPPAGTPPRLTTAGDLAQIFRAEHGRVVATLIRVFGSIDLAEDAAQEAFVAAVQRWPTDGVPPNPGAWLTTTARNRAIDRLRRESTRVTRQREAMSMIPTEVDEPEPAGAVADDRLRLIFTCCHPALAVDARVALTLRLLGGLTTGEIAAGFLVSETTMAQRITRAKKKIAAARIPYRVPADHELPARVPAVLAALYLIFNEGYLSSSPETPLRHDLSSEAIRLARVLVEVMPDEPEAVGLLGLMLLIDARRSTRVNEGMLVPLPDQDRARWDSDLIAEGHLLVRACLRRNAPGPYQLLAAVNAVHTDAATSDDTDWRQILALYDQLLALTPHPIVALNRAIAVGEIRGAAAALKLVDTLMLEGYHPWHASRADLLRRLDRNAEAAEAYRRGIDLVTNTAERAYLQMRLDQLPRR
ncbi:RNA polymerase sigma-70 factor (ECF subfamily) [Nakamurella sp. UYEF19]|uniref:RNA polymerase sigma factor n=1 Tax=Nakamurella sp. UYEF19 TaxID=1756392 RepID=UPI00339963A3